MALTFRADRTRRFRIAGGEAAERHAVAGLIRPIAPDGRVDAQACLCYWIQALSRRFLSALFILTLASAHAAAAAGDPLSLDGRAATAGQAQLALCPASRPMVQIGRQADAQTASPQALPFGMAFDAGSPSLAPRWVRLRCIHTTAAKRIGHLSSSRSTRGPPGHDSRFVES